MKKIYILGSLNMDLVISAPYMPVAGETIAGSDFIMNPGGKGANQAAACGKLGGAPVMAGCVGSDVFGDELLSTLEAHRVDTSCIRRVEGSSGIADAVFSVEGELNLEKLGLSESEGRKLIDELTAEMLRAAEALEFERAADLRDQIKALKKEK